MHHRLPQADQLADPHTVQTTHRITHPWSTYLDASQERPQWMKLAGCEGHQRWNGARSRRWAGGSAGVDGGWGLVGWAVSRQWAGWPGWRGWRAGPALTMPWPAAAAAADGTAGEQNKVLKGSVLFRQQILNQLRYRAKYWRGLYCSDNKFWISWGIEQSTEGVCIVQTTNSESAEEQKKVLKGSVLFRQVLNHLRNRTKYWRGLYCSDKF